MSSASGSDKELSVKSSDAVQDKTCKERIEIIALAMEELHPGAGDTYRKLSAEFCLDCPIHEDK